jgi:hypothetical protein
VLVLDGQLQIQRVFIEGREIDAGPATMR